MATEKLRVGVVGVGSIGKVHLTGYAAAAAAGDVEIHAIADPHDRRRNEMGDLFGVDPTRRYEDHETMLAEEPLDIVSVCTPNLHHFDVAKSAILKGCHTLCEKPLTLDMDQARMLKTLAAEQGVKTMVAFSHRFMAGNIEGKRLIDAGELGKPFMIRVRYAHGGPYPGWAQGDWFYDPVVSGGGALLDMGIHAIDIVRCLVGPIHTVSGQVRTLRRDIDVDDNAVLVLDFGPEAKCLGYIECGWTSGPGFGGIEVYGDNGTCLVLDFDEPRMMRGVKNPDGTETVETTKLTLGDGPSHWPLQMKSWVDFVLGRPTPTPIPGLDEGIASLEVALAATESSRTGRRIDVGPAAAA